MAYFIKGRVGEEGPSQDSRTQLMVARSRQMATQNRAKTCGVCPSAEPYDVRGVVLPDHRSGEFYANPTYRQPEQLFLLGSLRLGRSTDSFRPFTIESADAGALRPERRRPRKPQQVGNNFIH